MRAESIYDKMKQAPNWAAPDGSVKFWAGDSFNGGSTWIGQFIGESPWERHLEGDEFIHVVEGESEVTIRTSDGPKKTVVAAGSSIVVPKGHWHKQKALQPVLQFGATSGPTDHSETDDPGPPSN